jgi:hypothetical protein
MFIVFHFQSESEIVPFPNKPIDFQLPERDYTHLTEADFPRMHVVAAASAEEVKIKPEGK